MFKILASVLIFIPFGLFANSSMDNVRYSSYFKTKDGICILSVNGLDYLSTLNDSRTISAGSDITDALENDKENTIGLIFSPSESDSATDIYSCEVKLVKVMSNKSEEVITNFKVTFDGKSNRPFNDPNGYSIQDINDTTKKPIIRGISNRIIFNGDDKPEDWLTAYRSFYVSGIPEWQWTKAAPQLNNQDLRNQLILAYKDLINDLKTSDLATIKKKYSIALEEYAKTDLTDDTELFFDSIGIVNAVKKGKVDLNPNWDKFELLTYHDNRMFCLGIGGASRKSPIQFLNDKGKHIYSWNPFFSVINGKMVLVR